MTLEEERKGCIERAEAIFKKAQDEGRAMTEDEAKNYDAELARADEISKELEAQCERAAKLKEAQERAAKIRSAVVNPTPKGKGFDGSELRDIQKFSLGRALKLIGDRRSIDGVEAEVFTEGAKEAGASGVCFDSKAYVIPASAIRAIVAKQREMHKRATSVTSTDGDTVSSTAWPSIFEMFRNRLVLPKLGANVFDGLVGNVKVSTQTGAGGDLAPITETAAATSLDPTLNMVELSPKRFAAYTQLSNQLIMQSAPSVQDFAVNNLMKSILVGFEKQVFQGASSASIVGIPNVTGVNTSNVAAANSPTWGEILALVADLAGKDFDIERSGFALNATLMTTLMSTLKSANNFQFIMSEFFNSDGLKSLAGLKAAVSNNVGDGLIFGAWDSLFVGQWAGIGLIYDPYTQSINGAVNLVAEGFFDAQLGNPDLFSVLSMSVASSGGGGNG